MSDIRPCPGCGATVGSERFCVNCGAAIPQFHDSFSAPAPAESTSPPPAAPEVFPGPPAVVDPGCQFCGDTPSVSVTLRQETGKLLWRTRRSIDGRFCRNCGLATFRHMQNRTLITGWWGVISFFVNIASILANIGAWSKIRVLGSPDGNDVSTSALDPGPVLFRRAGVWFAVVVLVIAGSVVASEASGEEDYYAPSSQRSTTGSPYGSKSAVTVPRYHTTPTSDTWSELDKSQLRSTAIRAGLDYTEASCVVRYLTSRYSPSDYISQTAVSNAADYCL